MTTILQVRNDVASAIQRRVVAARAAGETFRVFLLLPLLPAFEGDVSGESGTGGEGEEVGRRRRGGGG